MRLIGFRDVQSVSETLSRIINALLHVDDVYLRKLAKANNCSETDLIGLFNTLRNIYGVTTEHIQEFSERTTLPPDTQKRKQNACYMTIVNAFFRDSQFSH